MLYLKRKIDFFLSAWKSNPDRKPLIVKGPRQVGKTESIRRFGEQNYKSVISINFVEEPKYKMITTDGYKAEDIIKNISRIDPSKRFIEGETLFFFDELQEFPEIATALKFFKIDGRFDVICSGSMLGINYRKIESNSVGYKSDYEMFSLDFEEFLWALDKKDLANMIRQAFSEDKEFSLHSLANQYYRLYLAIGGMPRAILEYKEKQDMDFVTAILKDINNSYIADMAKYASPTETTKIMAVYNIISAQLAKENRKFQYKLIKSGARAYEYETAINWLNASGIINQCTKIKGGKLPLSAFIEPESFKIYMSDVGLLCNKFGIPTNIVIVENDNMNDFKGALAENYVCNSLVQCGLKPYYWESNGKAEVDFVVQDKEGNIIPIEVKSSIHTRSKSLNVFKSLYKIPYSIRISTKNFGFENDIKCIPLYSVFCLDNL